MAFIDIHGHYAWDIDDGMPSLEDAKKALEKAKNNRISTIVATPHVVSGKHTLKDLEVIKDRIHDLKELAKVYNIAVLEGCELFLNHDYLEALEQNIFIPIENTHYLLVEFDVRKELGNGIFNGELGIIDKLMQQAFWDIMVNMLKSLLINY